MWWLLSASLAAGPCEPHDVGQWGAELELAEQALQALAIEQADTWLEAIAASAPCLTEPAPRALLRRHAELQVLRHMYDQDSDGLERWARHRHRLGQILPWTTVSTDHPVHRFASGVEPGEEQVVGQALPPKRGGVFIDGRWVTEISLEVGAQHLVQVFDADGRAVDGAWVRGVAIDERWVGAGGDQVPPRWYQGPGAEAFLVPEWKAARKDTLAAYEKYLRKNPIGDHASEAKRRIDAIHWAAYDKTPTGARAYLADWPKGRHRREAEGILQREALDAAIAEGTREALQLFVGRYPSGMWVAEADRRLEAMAWAAAIRDNTEQGYARYRVRWPRGAHLEEAALAQEERAWATAVDRGRSGLQDYVRAWPDGHWAPQARRMLDGSRFRRVAVLVEGDGAEGLHRTLHAAAEAELRALGLEPVTEAGPRDGRVVVQVREVDVGVGQVRPGLQVTVGVGDDPPVLDDEVLLEPMPLGAAEELLRTSMAASLRRVATVNGR